jgi:hypothetical protein
MTNNALKCYNENNKKYMMARIIAMVADGM